MPQPQNPLPAEHPERLLIDHTAWSHLYDQAGPVVRATVAELVRQHAAALATRFYETLLTDQYASRLLSHDLVATHLHGSLQRWMVTIFGNVEEVDIPALIELQHRVGAVHARLMVPIPLVSRGARILKDEITCYLRESPLSRHDLSWAQQFIGGMFDLALEVMSVAYLRDTNRNVRADEAYRLFSLGQNVSAERERQRAALMEWAQEVLIRLYEHPGQTVMPPRLRDAEFGLWIRHKGSVMFEGTAEMPRILEDIASLDDIVQVGLTQAVAAGNGMGLAAQVQLFRARTDEIKYLLNTLFDRISALEGGRDPLTQLLNRRFLPSVLSREMGLANSGQSTFSVLLLDVDYFKRINDAYGHDGGDTVLRQVAEKLQESCRAADYLFRYGGEEFLVVLADTGEDKLAGVAEKLRRVIKEHAFRSPHGDALPVTVSVGGAAFNGDPDMNRLIKRADDALYAAKSSGRDQWRLG